MFERLWLSGSRQSGRRLMRAALMATLTFGAWSGPELSAFGQLRSGSVDRPLYHSQASAEHEHLAVEPTPGPRQSATWQAATAQRQTRPASSAYHPQSGRASANMRSRVVRAGSPHSIVEAPMQEQIPPAAVPRVVPPTNIQPTPDPLPNDDNMTTFAEGYGGFEGYAGEMAGAGGGCSCGRCGGGDYFQDLAPGCSQSTCGMSACDGPLSRLLGRMSVRAEAALFWRRSMGLPPLVTTADAGTAANLAGQLGQSTTDTLLGNSLVNQEMHAGFRINASTWLDPSCYRGVIVRYANAGDQSNDFLFTSNTNPILARPFNNITTGTSTPDTQLVAFPGDSVGDIRVRTTSEIDSIDVVLKRLAYRDRFTRVDWLLGYQHNHIAESLQISSNTTVTGNVPPLTGTSLAVTDLVQTTNNFDGAVLGLMSTRQFAYFKFEALGRLGIGSLERSVELSGVTTTTSSAGVTTTDPQGLLVRNTNNRPFKDDTFVTVPEFGLNVGYYLTPNIDFTVGYNYLLIPKTAQPGNQLDGTINLSDPLSGAMRPALALSTLPYWLHSLNLGAQWRY